MRRAAWLLLLAACAGLAGCSDDATDPDDGVLYQLGFVTIMAPDTSPAGEPIPVWFEMIFADTCQLYDHRETVLHPHRADVTLWGRDMRGPCLAVVYTDTTNLLIPAAEAGPFRIVVHVAGGDSLVHEVSVE